MATRKYKSKKHLSKKHGKKSQKHTKSIKKTRKYRKKHGGDEVDTKYLPQYEEIIETLDNIGKGNKSQHMTVPGQLGDRKLMKKFKPTDLLEQYLTMDNSVSCKRRLLIGDKQNCDEQKKKLYTNIVKKIQETKEKINGEDNSSLTDVEVSTITEILTRAKEHFGSKLTSHA